MSSAYDVEAAPQQPRFKALFQRLRFGGSVIRVSPGDDLFPNVSGAAETLSMRELGRHWAVRSVSGQIARGLAGCELAVWARTGEENADIQIADQRGASMLRPHIRRIARDVARFGEAILVMAEDGDGTVRELVPLPPDEVVVTVEGGVPVLYALGEAEYKPGRILHITEEAPAESPIEELRPILEEDIAASEWRRDAWKTAPRGIISRDLDAPEWSGKARNRFTESLLAQLTGKAPHAARGFALLEDGMAWHDTPLPDAQSAQFIEARRLTAEIVASTYGVQGSLLATGADKQIGPARRQLLTGPVSDIGLLISTCSAEQLMPRLYGSQAVNGRIHVVFDVEKAVRREDEDANLRINSVGRPWRTPNEQREAEGREPIAGGDSLGNPAPRAVVTQ